MKTLKLISRPALIVTLMSTAFAAGCIKTTPENSRTAQTEEDAGVPAIGNVPDTGESYTTQEAYSTSMNDRLEALDARIDSIESRLGEKGEDVRTAYAAQMEKLKGNLEAAETQLNNLKSASQAEWQDMRDGVGQAFADLEATVNEAERWLQAH